MNPLQPVDALVQDVFVLVQRTAFKCIHGRDKERDGAQELRKSVGAVKHQAVAIGSGRKVTRPRVGIGRQSGRDGFPLVLVISEEQDRIETGLNLGKLEILRKPAAEKQELPAVAHTPLLRYEPVEIGTPAPQPRARP